VNSCFGHSLPAVSGLVSIGLLLVFAGCGAREKETSDKDMATIREKVDGVRRCASLLTGEWPIEASADGMSGARVDALVAAGLIRRVPLEVPEGERARTRIEVTPAGKADVLIERPSPKARPDDQEPLLCYGRRQVTSFYDKQMQASETGDPAVMTSVLHYDYRIVQPPAWTARADIRAAFPFMVRDLDKVHTAHEGAVINKQPETGEFFAP
jgi:hypothetical protein